MLNEEKRNASHMGYRNESYWLPRMGGASTSKARVLIRTNTGRRIEYVNNNASGYEIK